MNDKIVSKEITIINQIDELTPVAGWLEEVGEEWELPLPLVLSLNLVLEEALTNTILYGYEEELPHEIHIRLEKHSEELKLTITDDGRAYDPTQKEDPDITLSVEDRPIGGLGILLIKKIMNSVDYQRISNKNILILKKNIHP